MGNVTVLLKLVGYVLSNEPLVIKKLRAFLFKGDSCRGRVIDVSDLEDWDYTAGFPDTEIFKLKDRRRKVRIKN